MVFATRAGLFARCVAVATLLAVLSLGSARAGVVLDDATVAQEARRGASPADVAVAVSWSSVLRQTVSTPTFQNSVDPYYRMDSGEFSSRIAKRVFELEQELRATHVRHVPWFPYPRLAVAQLFAPSTTGDTHWDFSLIDPITDAFVGAMEDRPVVMNFATIPQWMFNTSEPAPVPDDPNQRDVDYEQGTVLRDPSMKELVRYYVNLYKYYCKGGFTDEAGRWVEGHKFAPFAWFEIFNEMEYSTTKEDYTLRYDAIVTALWVEFPDAKFMGLAMGSHNQFDYYTYFLDSRNHQPATVPVDGFSFHHYVIPPEGVTDYDSVRAAFFAQTDAFVNETETIQAIRDKLRPDAQLFINEIGCAWSGPDPAFGWPKFWSLCGSMYAYLYGQAAARGVEFLGQSQMIGFVNGTYSWEWPSTSMVDWTTGEPNARYTILKLLIDRFTAAGDSQPPAGTALVTTKGVVATKVTGTAASLRAAVEAQAPGGLYAQAFTRPSVQAGQASPRTLLVVSTSATNVVASLPGADMCASSGLKPRLCWVDAATAPGPYRCSAAVDLAAVTFTPSMVAVLDCN